MSGGAVMALIAFSISSGPSALAQRPTQDPNAAAAPNVVRMVGPVRLDQDLRNLRYVPQEGETEVYPLTRYPHRNTGAAASQTSGFAPIQSVIKEILRPTPAMPAPLLTFEGGAARPVLRLCAARHRRRCRPESLRRSGQRRVRGL